MKLIISIISFFILLSLSSCSSEKINNIEPKKETTNLKKEETKFDLKLDTSLQKYVDNKIHFNDLSYIPKNLKKVDLEYVIDTKWNSRLKTEALLALNSMSLDFYNTFEKKMILVSAYRSYKYQKWIKDRGCPDNLCAKAWYSEHQSWLAIDLWETSTQKDFLSKPHLKKYFQWLNKNAHKYGFHNTYKNWLEIDWYEIEPWHWRYVWEKLATNLKEKDCSFSEFYYKNCDKKVSLK